MVLPMYRLILLLLLSVLGHDVLQASAQESYTSPTDQPYLEDTSALTVSPTTVGTTSAETDFSLNPSVPSSTVSSPLSDTSETTDVPIIQQSSTTLDTATEISHTTASTHTTPVMSTATEMTTDETDPTVLSSTSTTTEAATDETNPTVLSTTTTPEVTSKTTEAATNETNPTTVLSTTTTPDITNITTHFPTNATTVAPTNVTTSFPINATTSGHNATVPTYAPTTLPPQPNPAVGNYTIPPDHNSSVCLIAKMGLQFSFNDGSHVNTVNLDPMSTKASGTCGNNVSSSALLLTSDKITVQFVFVKQQGRFHLSVLDLTINTETGMPFHVQSTNLSLWEASLGSSYMCQKEQSYNISDDLLLKTFELQVQPFNVSDNKFSTAHECSMDDISLLIPIIVGAALAGLIVIVLIAYVIGRRKTYVGYQTL